MRGGAMALLLAAICLAPVSAYALSELKPATPPAGDAAEPGAPGGENAAPTVTVPPLEGPQTGPDGGLPDPGPLIRPPASSPVEATEAPQAPETAAPPPEIIRDPARLPEPVARLRTLIMEAAETGDPEKLRPLLGKGETATRLSLGGTEEDPVEYLVSISGDPAGQEILAILLDILSTGFVHLDENTPEELYVWPYFAAMPIETLTPAQRVDLLRIVTAGDVEDMLAYGSYNFYRLGITPDGEWRYFLAGD